jgi:hypothetical protein
MHRLNMKLDPKVYLGSMSRDMHSCTHWLRPRDSPPLSRIWTRIRGRYWSANIDDISFYVPETHIMYLTRCC